MSKCPECINRRGYGHTDGCKGLNCQAEDSLNKSVYEAALELSGLYYFDFSTGEPLDDIDSFFAQFHHREGYQEELVAAGNRLADALYGEEVT